MQLPEIQPAPSRCSYHLRCPADKAQGTAAVVSHQDFFAVNQTGKAGRDIFTGLRGAVFRRRQSRSACRFRIEAQGVCILRILGNITGHIHRIGSRRQVHLEAGGNGVGRKLRHRQHDFRGIRCQGKCTSTAGIHPHLTCRQSIVGIVLILETRVIDFFICSRLRNRIAVLMQRRKGMSLGAQQRQYQGRQEPAQPI